jgi:hypothetical protein
MSDHEVKFRNVILQLLPAPEGMAAVFNQGMEDPYRTRPAPRKSVIALALVRVEIRTASNDWAYHDSRIDGVVLSSTGRFVLGSVFNDFDAYSRSGTEAAAT